VQGRIIENLLGCVQAKTIEMKLRNPVAGVGDEELAAGARVLAVEV
jgi:hypothetical protein